MAESWDGVARAYDRVSRDSRVHRAKIVRVAGLIIASGARSVLDVGCGSGLLEARLFADGFEGSVTAVDASAQMVAIAREANAGHSVIVEQRDLNVPLPYANATFDCAVSVNVFFLLDDPGAVMREVRRVLDVGALFLLVMPKPEVGSTWDSLREHFRGLGFAEAIRELAKLIAGLPAVITTWRFRTKLDSEHVRAGSRYMTQDEIEQALSDAGFLVQTVSDIQAGHNWLFECVAT
jgi:SAM-dependent methyltransferase